MKTSLKPIDQLTRADYNPRVELDHHDPEYQHLRASIERFGVVDPLVWNSRSARLVAGHQRLTVLSDMGFDEVPVVEVDLDEDEERALNVALNKIEGRWDDQKLLDVLTQLEAADFELETVGFDDDQFDDLMRRIDQAESTAFLDDLATADDEIKEAGGDIDPGDHTPDEFAVPWYSMSFAVTSDERQTILAMLRLAQKIYGVDTSPKALVHIAESFLAEHGEGEPSTAVDQPAEEPA